MTSTSPTDPNNPESLTGAVPPPGQTSVGFGGASEAPGGVGGEEMTPGGSQGPSQQPTAEGANAPSSEPGHRPRLPSNNSYNLIRELSELLAGTWRIDGYLRDAGADDCQDCGKLWQDVRKQNEILIEKLRQEIVAHAKNGTFT